MIEISTRKKNQPAPPFAVSEALTDFDRDRSRPWLNLLADERRPRVLRAEHPSLVLWSSLWPALPELQIRFDLPRDAAGQGTDLRWTLLAEDSAVEPATVRQLRYRLNTLINAHLRDSFDQ